MDNESMGYLYTILEECERKCRKCSERWNHVLHNNPRGNGLCSNMIQKNAVQRVIVKRLGRINDNKNSQAV